MAYLHVLRSLRGWAGWDWVAGSFCPSSTPDCRDGAWNCFRNRLVLARTDPVILQAIINEVYLGWDQHLSLRDSGSESIPPRREESSPVYHTHR